MNGEKMCSKPEIKKDTTNKYVSTTPAVSAPQVQATEPTLDNEISGSPMNKPKRAGKHNLKINTAPSTGLYI